MNENEKARRWLAGRLRIARVSEAFSDGHVEILLQDVASPQKGVAIHLTYRDLAKALLGRAECPVLYQQFPYEAKP